MAAHDSTEKGHTSLGDYLEQKGESPRQWLGAGLAGLDIQTGDRLTVEQMKALFGDGQHPNAIALENPCDDTGATKSDAIKVGALGRAFSVFKGSNAFRSKSLGGSPPQFRSEQEVEHRDPRRGTGPDPHRGRHRDFHDGLRSPAGRELSKFITRTTRQATTAVAGYDLTFSPVKSGSALWAIAPLPITKLRYTAETIYA